MAMKRQLAHIGDSTMRSRCGPSSYSLTNSKKRKIIFRIYMGMNNIRFSNIVLPHYTQNRKS